MVFDQKNRLYLSLSYQNKQVKVTLEFPGQTDLQAEQEFTDRLKEICLAKAEGGKQHWLKR